MTADQRKIITEYLQVPFNLHWKDWNLVMPAVRKVGEDLMEHWKQDQDTEAWALQTNMEFYVVNVQLSKAVKHLIEAIQWITKKKELNTGKASPLKTQN